MQEFMQAGGAPMIAIALFGGLCLIAGGVYAVRPSPRLLLTISALGVSVLFSIAAGTLADFAAVGANIPAHPEWMRDTDLSLVLLQGFAESMSPGILGFSLLSLTALECAVGLARSARSA
jgi:hypothetical protein